VDFLLLFNESIVLGDTAKCKFVHEIDFIRLVHILNRERLDRSRKCGAEQHDLAILRVKLEKLLDNGRKFR